MAHLIDPRIIDMTFFIIANLVNILIICILLVRIRGKNKVESVLGIVVVVMALPMVAGDFLNFLGKREWWTFILPLFLILYCIIEWIFDYLLKLDFRNTKLFWPYLLIYYLGLMGMIGYSFSMGKPYGFVTLGTYFLNLFSTWYSYSKIGHG